MSLHFHCSARGWQHFRSERWGPCRRWIEVADDRMASRQIEFYESGQILAYDRAHSIDERGMLIRLQFSRKQKWRKLFTDVQPSSASEFDREWRIVAERAKS